MANIAKLFSRTQHFDNRKTLRYQPLLGNCAVLLADPTGCIAPQAAKEMAQQQIQFLKTQLQHFPGSAELKEQLSAFEEMYREIDQYEEMDMEMQSLSMKHYSSRSSYILHKKSNLSASRMAMRNRELGEEEN